MSDGSAEIRQLISSNKLNAAIDLLSSHISGKDPDLELQLSLLTSRLARLNLESRMGLLSRADENSERTRITFGLLGLVADAQELLNGARDSITDKDAQQILEKTISQKELEMRVKELNLLLDKLAFLKEKQVLIADHNQQFQLTVEIEALEKRIEELRSMT